jgi:hypothetical protein
MRFLCILSGKKYNRKDRKGLRKEHEERICELFRKDWKSNMKE